MYGNDMRNGQQAYPIYPSPMQWGPYTQKHNLQPTFNGLAIGYAARQGETSRISPTMEGDDHDNYWSLVHYCSVKGFGD